MENYKIKILNQSKSIIYMPYKPLNDYDKKIDDILDESGGTVVLSQDLLESESEEETTILGVQTEEEGTTLLGEEEGTTLLTEEKDIVEKKCNVIREITVFEAKEYIDVER